MKNEPVGIAALLAELNEQELRRLLVEHLTKQKLGLVWERSAIEHDRALNASVVLPLLCEDLSYRSTAHPDAAYRNLIVEGDNFDALRLLKTTHANRIRVIYIDPPYNTGRRDWVYNDRYVGEHDRWRHSQWVEFLYRRLALARDLLTPDGVLLASINDENRARLELLLDEIFPTGRVGSLVWRTKDTGNDGGHRLSHVHEHILVYANERFKFNGRPVDASKFRNPDNDLRGIWSPRPLTKAHTFLERRNTYYPIQDRDTGYWYPCDPDSVWRFASEQEIRRRFNGDSKAIAAALAGLRGPTMEELIAQRLIYFPPCDPSEVLLFSTKAELLAALRAGKGPRLPKKKTPLLREDLPDLDFWIGKPIAPGRPSRKEHWSAKPESERLAPLSSWIAGLNEVVDFDEDDLEAPEVLRSPRGGVATDEVKRLLGAKLFPHPKPLALIEGLLEQATKPGDIVLDFFAGSATTAHAVLSLNARDAGARRFILCSNTEATRDDRNRNVCRDACAVRVRRVIDGHADAPPLAGDFGYLKLDRLDPAEAQLDFTAEHAYALLTLRYANAALPYPAQAVNIVVSDGEHAIVYVPEVDGTAIRALIALPQPRLTVYSTRPQTVAEKLETSGKSASSYAVGDAIMAGQLPGTGTAR